MSDDRGDIFNPISYERASKTLWTIGDKTFVPDGVELDPRIRILESHKETIGNDIIVVIDRFEIIKAGIIP